MGESFSFFITALIIFLFSFVLSLSTNDFIIKRAIKKNLFQTIHALGVQEHKKKAHTPSFAGVGMFLSILISNLILNTSFVFSKTGGIVIFLYTSFFLIGFVDDYIKVYRKNENGLFASSRILLELLVIIITLFMLGYENKTMWGLLLPFKFGYIYLGIAYLILFIFIILASANASNLVDGLDGLNGGLMLILTIPFFVYAINQREGNFSLFILTVSGSLLGFLIYNLHPAKIFMGDCGSLPLGAFIGFSTLYFNVIFQFLFMALIFIVETLSVIIQVIYFKKTKKRVFLMAPLHHHFELKGFKEWKICLSYYVIQIALVLLGLIF